MRLETTLRDLADDERLLAAHLRALADRHADEPEVRLLALDLADWSTGHAEGLVPWTGPSDVPAEWGEEPWSSDPGLVLLGDLAAVHVHAIRVALVWQLVGMAARTTHDDDLAALEQRCRPQSLRQAQWAAAEAKQAATQILVT